MKELSDAERVNILKNLENYGGIVHDTGHISYLVKLTPEEETLFLIEEEHKKYAEYLSKKYTLNDLKAALPKDSKITPLMSDKYLFRKLKNTEIDQLRQYSKFFYPLLVNNDSIMVNFRLTENQREYLKDKLEGQKGRMFTNQELRMLYPDKHKLGKIRVYLRDTLVNEHEIPFSFDQ
jgi:hypothetical protein